MKSFVFDITVDAENLCNLISEKQQLLQELESGGHVVIYGRRNTGKTSLIKNVALPEFEKRHGNVVTIFADLMGVENLEDLTQRIHKAFERSVVKAFPKQQSLKDLTKILRGLRPTASFSSTTGEISFSLDVESQNKKIDLDILFKNIAAIHKKMKTVLVFDEFQDIAHIPSGQALMRGVLQGLPHRFPVLLMGSKKHLLAKIFGSPDAPLAGWGTDLLIPTIESKAYRQAYLYYVNERFVQAKLSMTLEVLDELLLLVQGIPEPANIVCHHLVLSRKPGQISKEDIVHAYIAAVEKRAGRFEERLSRFRENERKILIALAKYGPIAKPKGKEFLHKVSELSPTSLFSLIHKLENSADIYKTIDGYIVADPLFAEYLKKFR